MKGITNAKKSGIYRHTIYTDGGDKRIILTTLDAMPAQNGNDIFRLLANAFSVVLTELNDGYTSQVFCCGGGSGISRAFVMQNAATFTEITSQITASFGSDTVIEI